MLQALLGRLEAFREAERPWNVNNQFRIESYGVPNVALGKLCHIDYLFIHIIFL